MDEGEEQIALPHDFMQADVDHIVLLIGESLPRSCCISRFDNFRLVDMLGRLIAHNDNIPLSPSVEVNQIDNLDTVLSDRSETLTRFHSRSPPAIPVLDYLRRIVRYTKVEVWIAMSSFYFYVLLTGANPEILLAHYPVLYRSDLHSDSDHILPHRPSVPNHIDSDRLQGFMRCILHQYSLCQSRWNYPGCRIKPLRERVSHANRVETHRELCQQLPSLRP